MLDFLSSLVPSWFNLSSAWLFAIGGAVGVVYAMFPLAPYRGLARAAGVLALGYAAYLSGFAAAQEACEASELRRQLTSLETQNDALRNRIETEAAARRADAARAASDFASDTANQERIDATPPNDRPCIDRDAAARVRGVR